MMRLSVMILIILMSTGLFAQDKKSGTKLFSTHKNLQIIDSTLCEVFSIRQDSKQKEDIRFRVEKYIYAETVGDIWTGNMSMAVINVYSSENEGFLAHLFFSDDEILLNEPPDFNAKNKSMQLYFQADRLEHVLHLLENYKNVFVHFWSDYHGRSFAILEVAKVSTGN